MKPFTTRARWQRPARGMTLIELMVVMAIIAILGGLVLGAISQATGVAKLNKTKSIITRINQQLTARWESYRYRRMPVDMRQAAVTQGLIANVNQATPKTLAAARLNSIRSLMRYELPQAYDELVNPASWNVATHQGLNQPATARSYYRKYSSVTASGTNESAECLFMIMSQGLGFEGISAYDLVPDSVGDTDGDGMREFLDGWGQPIRFIRWAPAFISPLQPSFVSSTAGASQNHDGFDSLGVDPDAFALYPLVYSIGPDGEGGLQSNSSSLQRNANGLRFQPDPYYISLSAGLRSGAIDSTATPGCTLDNIHNHALDLR